LNAPNPLSTITALPSTSQGVSPPVGGDVGGPVDASAVLADGETDGASACIAGDGDAVEVVAADVVTLAPRAAEGVTLRDGGAAVGACAGGHTWLNETVGGRAPVPME
jgi:hypothetical protein